MCDVKRCCILEYSGKTADAAGRGSFSTEFYTERFRRAMCKIHSHSTSMIQEFRDNVQSIYNGTTYYLYVMTIDIEGKKLFVD